jgi:predicted RNA polymerase sigma factor
LQPESPALRQLKYRAFLLPDAVKCGRFRFRHNLAPKDARMAFTTDSSIDDLLNDATVRAILDKHMPGMAAHPQIGMARSMGLSLKAVAGFSGGKITDAMLDAVAQELA